MKLPCLEKSDIETIASHAIMNVKNKGFQLTTHALDARKASDLTSSML